MTQAEMGKTVGVPLYWLRPFRSLSTAPGMHRWLWDLHYPTPKTAEHDYPIAAVPYDTLVHPLGPRAVPGQYTVRLTVEGHSFAAPLEVKMDPRVATSHDGLEAQFRAEMDLAATMDSGSEAAAMAAALKTGLQGLIDKNSGQGANPVAQAAAALQSKLKAILEAEKPAAGAAPNDAALPATLSQVNGQLAGLYGLVDNADAAPTDTQSKALATLKHDFGDVMARWNQLKSVDLPAINQQLRDAGQTPLALESQPAAPGESHNEE